MEQHEKSFDGVAHWCGVGRRSRLPWRMRSIIRSPYLDCGNDAVCVGYADRNGLHVHDARRIGRKVHYLVNLRKLLERHRSACQLPQRVLQRHTGWTFDSLGHSGHADASYRNPERFDADLRRTRPTKANVQASYDRHMELVHCELNPPAGRRRAVRVSPHLGAVVPGSFSN
jgi:hypothetical protein